MAELKTKENKASVSEFLASIDDKQKSEMWENTKPENHVCTSNVSKTLA